MPVTQVNKVEENDDVGSHGRIVEYTKFGLRTNRVKVSFSTSVQTVSKIFVSFSENLLYFYKIGCIMSNKINTGELVLQAERK